MLLPASWYRFKYNIKSERGRKLTFFYTVPLGRRFGCGKIFLWWCRNSIPGSLEFFRSAEFGQSDWFLFTHSEREREKKRIAVCNIRKERGNKGTSYENGVGRNGKFYEVSSFPGQRWFEKSSPIPTFIKMLHLSTRFVNWYLDALFSILVCYQKTIPGPHMNRQTRSGQFFCFREDILEIMSA